MKKTILLLLVALLPLCVYGQSIQTKFYGLKIGKKYSPDRVKEVLRNESDTKKYGIYKNENGLNVEVESVSFGGHTWQAVACSLLPSNNRLYSVWFLDGYDNDFAHAILLLSEMASKLKAKYGEGYFEAKDNSASCAYQWTDSNGMSIQLKLDDVTLDDEHTKHWVTLRYVDLNLMKQLSTSSLDEL